MSSSFEGLSSSLAHLPGELWSCKVVRKYQLLWELKIQIYCTPAVNKLKIYGTLCGPQEMDHVENH